MLMFDDNSSFNCKLIRGGFMKQIILNTIRSLIFALSLIALAYTSVSSASNFNIKQKEIKLFEIQP